VPHHSRVSQIVVDADPAAHDATLSFWQAATGQKATHIERFPEFHSLDLAATDVGMLVQRLGDGPSRVHIDIHADDLAAEVARLEALGATVQRWDGEAPWCVLRDPAGLLFCVVRDPRVDESNGRRWD
jgi:hypothetical protein